MQVVIVDEQVLSGKLGSFKMSDEMDPYDFKSELERFVLEPEDLIDPVSETRHREMIVDALSSGSSDIARATETQDDFGLEKLNSATPK